MRRAILFFRRTAGTLTTLDVDVATTNDERVRGLSHRRVFRPLLFPMIGPLTPEQRAFHTMQMVVPIEFVTIGPDQRIAQRLHIHPGMRADVPADTSYVLELPVGLLDERGIGIGDSLVSMR